MAAVSVGTSVAVTQAEQARIYVECINIKGNTCTKDFVIRREFDFFEGDSYSRALLDRTERRIKNLGYFKSVTVTTEPGSTPDRIIVDLILEEDMQKWTRTPSCGG